MAPTTDQTRPWPRLRGKAWIALAIVVLLGCAWAIWNWWPGGSRRIPPDPRMTFDSPFLNVRPHVKYVGDAVCANCHQDITDVYAHHAMGRAMYPTPSAPELERYQDPASNPFTYGPLRYDIERRGDKVFHIETLSDQDGTVLARLEAEAEYAIGSGTRGRSYVVNRDGFLFESPISWYTQKQRWDLSPGYHQSNSHFQRPIQTACLFCHCNFAHESPNTINRYSPPYFTGFVIGCERCHGPGELHAEKPLKVNGIDRTIVNPRHLAPELREDICQQCHLQGEQRIVRAGRQIFDYRPGLPFSAFLAVFVKPPELTQGMKAVSQVEQMFVSRCFQASNGSMGCTSCHDPHRSPKPEQKAAFFRERCLSCHDTKPCSVPVVTRRQQSAEDSCMQCHMPQLGSNIAHTALTDHRVLRHADSAEKAEQPTIATTLVPLRHFHSDRVDANTPDAGRDFGIAITNFARRVERQVPLVPIVRKAEPLLAASTELWPGDVPGWEALGYAYRKQGKLLEAQRAYDAALARAPEREQTLTDLADMASQAQKPHEAIHYYERLIRVNPQHAGHYVSLAHWLHREGEWQRSLEACQSALRLDIVHTEARQLLIANQLRLGQPAQAEKELELLLKSSPSDRASFEAWFASQKRLR
jgi:predicted CXXCH cytochrome family protein